MFKIDYLSVPIDNQLWHAIVGIYNSNQLDEVTSLKTDPANLDICFILKFSIFYMTTVYVIMVSVNVFACQCIISVLCICDGYCTDI